MVRPKHFGYNAETAENNTFQSSEGAENDDKIKELGLGEFNEMVRLLRSEGVNVLVIEDLDQPVNSDAVFPNNWFTTHENGVLATYPMFSPSRRTERRPDIIEALEKKYGYSRRYEFEYLEGEELFLEGTGSMILDRQNKIVYACLSPRTSIMALDKFCVLFGYRKIIFHAVDDQGKDIYHTNVIMTLGSEFAVICMECIQNEDEKETVHETLRSTGKTVIEISFDQVRQFAGNMLEVRDHAGQAKIVLSESAYNALSIKQLETLASFGKLIRIPVPTIEKYGGGSVRCMMAEVFVPKTN